MLVAVAVLTYMVLWMRRESRTISGTLREGVDEAVRKGSAFALALLVFTMVLREGIETGLFVFGIAQTSTPVQVAVGAGAGLAAAVALGYAVYAGGRRINLGAFFKYTGALLILVAAGLLAQGVRAFEEAGVIPAILYPLWDLTGAPVVGMDTAFSAVLGNIFGWDPKPDLLEFAAWAVYLVGVGYAFLKPHAAERTAPRTAQAGK
jgi:high-affinity iron transporter